MTRRSKTYDSKIAVKESVQWTDLVGLSLKTPPDKPVKKKAKKKGS